MAPFACILLATPLHVYVHVYTESIDVEWIVGTLYFGMYIGRVPCVSYNAGTKSRGKTIL